MVTVGGTQKWTAGSLATTAFRQRIGKPFHSVESPMGQLLETDNSISAVHRRPRLLLSDHDAS